MLVKDTELLYFINQEDERVHLLDLNAAGKTSLVNAIDPTFQKEFIQQENLKENCIDFEWICYGMDGIIVSYKDYNFKYVNIKIPYLHKPFVEIMKVRRMR